MRLLTVHGNQAAGRRAALPKAVRWTWVLALGPWLGAAAMGQEAVRASESFEDYEASALAGNSGGSGWVGSWTPPGGSAVRADVVDTSGAPMTYVVPGGESIHGATRALEVQLAGTPANLLCGVRSLAAPIVQTFYVGYLVRHHAGASWAGGNNTFTLHLGTNATSTTTLNFGLRGNTTAGSDEFVVRYGTGNGATTGGQVETGRDYYLVAKMVHNGTAFTSAILWLDPSTEGEMVKPAGDAVLAFAGFSNPITHLFWREAALDADDVLRADELKLGTSYQEVVAPWGGTPAVVSFTLMDADSGVSVLGYDAMTNGAVINLFLTGTNLSVRANCWPVHDFGSVVFRLAGATAHDRIDNSGPWSLFGDSNGSYIGGSFNIGEHTLTATPYGGDDALGSAGGPASVNFTVVHTVVASNKLPVVTLTSPLNASVFVAPVDILLEAEATDTDGVVTNVQFFDGETKLGEAGNAPYALPWANVTAGNHSLTARATDNEGGMGVSPAVSISVLRTNAGGIVSGELKKWHRVMVTWEGPQTSEIDVNNPFRNYRLNVTFTHRLSGKRYLVPGCYAADGDAANTSAASGNRWRVSFAPDETGVWDYVASFRAGIDVALDPSPTAGFPSDFDGAGGSFVIGPTDKTGRDHRGKGRLQYVGKHHLRFAETGEYFLKMGADSPESLLDYEDFDDQPNLGNARKSWAPHAGDYDSEEAAEYTWAGNKGTELLGVLSYLSGKGLNAFSFIPFTLDGDNKAVFPHRLVGTAEAYGAAAEPRWNKNVVYHDRFDVSKLEQWDRVFAYADKRGLYLHFKTLETENELTMDGGNLGPERKLYYRELIARFGYHLALNWNLGEEVDSSTTAQKQAWSQYFYDTDPYRHHQVIHNGASHYDLLGAGSHLTGFSRQTSPGSIFSDTLNYLKRSAEAGVPWVVAYDEQNPAGDGIVTDGEDFFHDKVRGPAIWSHLLAGGAGCEFYFGYNHPHNDLNCQDMRSRDNWWNQCRYALEFFAANTVPFWNMTNCNGLLTGLTGTYCFALTGQVYVAYLPTNRTASLDLAGCPGQYTVRWFDPRRGGMPHTGTVAEVTGGLAASLGTAPLTSTNDWVVLVKAVLPIPAPSTISLVHTGGGWQAEWAAPDFQLYRGPQVAGPWTQVAPAPSGSFRMSTTNAAEYYQLRWSRP